MAIAKAGAINLEYFKEGSGPPLLLIMGFAGSAASWGEPFLERLRTHFTIIRFSNRGTGESDKPQEQTTIRMMADDTIALMGTLGLQQPHIVGISMGGMIAQEIAINYPQRVNRLVLGCTTPGFAHGVQASPETMGKLAPNPQLTREQIIEQFWTAICSPAFIESGAAFLAEMAAQALARPVPIDTLAKQMMAVQSFDAFDRIPQIKAKTLVIHGDVDQLVPTPNGSIIAERIPGAELRILPGAAHMFFWEQPEEAARIVMEFLPHVPAGA